VETAVDRGDLPLVGGTSARMFATARIRPPASNPATDTALVWPGAVCQRRSTRNTRRQCPLVTPVLGRGHCLSTQIWLGWIDARPSGAGRQSDLTPSCRAKPNQTNAKNRHGRRFGSRSAYGSVSGYCGGLMGYAGDIDNCAPHQTPVTTPVPASRHRRSSPAGHGGASRAACRFSRAAAPTAGFLARSSCRRSCAERPISGQRAVRRRSAVQRKYQQKLQFTVAGLWRTQFDNVGDCQGSIWT
jgi:hypothetical protein